MAQYNPGFYLNYLSRWPDLCCVQESPSGRPMGYGVSYYTRLVTQ